MKLPVTLSLFAVCTSVALFLLLDPTALSPIAKLPRRGLGIAAPPFKIEEVIQAMARKHQVKPAIVKSIIAAESAFQPEAISPKGALGLMQLMPETAFEMGGDPAVPEQNVEAGTRYLSVLLHRYEHKRDAMKLAIAAYNAGPGNVDRYGGIPPFPETRNYVTRVLRFYKQYSSEELAR